MGVNGLWQLLKYTAKPTNLEKLRGKIVAVGWSLFLLCARVLKFKAINSFLVLKKKDTSIWLIQFVRGMRNSEGGASHAAHLKGMFSRIVKLLFFGIKPIFVFDGPTPPLKQRVLRERSKLRNENNKKINELAKKLLLNQLQQTLLPKNNKSQQNSLKTQLDKTEKEELKMEELMKEELMKEELMEKVKDLLHFQSSHFPKQITTLNLEEKRKGEGEEHLSHLNQQAGEQVRGEQVRGEQVRGEQVRGELELPRGVDPLVFYSLPVELQQEILNSHFLQQEEEEGEEEEGEGESGELNYLYKTPKRRSSSAMYKEEMKQIIQKSKKSPIEAASSFSSLQLSNFLNNKNSSSNNTSSTPTTQPSTQPTSTQPSTPLTHFQKIASDSSSFALLHSQQLFAFFF